MTPDEWNAAIRKLIKAMNGEGLDEMEYQQRLLGLDMVWPEMAEAVREFTELAGDDRAQG